MGSQGIVGRRREAFNDDHLSGIDIDPVVVEIVSFLAASVLELTEVNFEGSFLSAAYNRCINAELFGSRFMCFELCPLNQFEAQFIAAPPGLFVDSAEPWFSLQYFIEYDITNRIEAVLYCVKDAPAGVFPSAKSASIEKSRSREVRSDNP